MIISLIYLYFLTASSFCYLPVCLCSTSCATYKAKLSQHIGQVTSCLSKYISPVAFCGWCHESLEQLQLILYDETARSPSGVPCIELLVFTDKVIMDLIKFIAATWNRSFCSKCLLLNSSSTQKMSDYWKRFSQLIDWSGLSFGEYSTVKLDDDRENTPDYNVRVYNNETIEFFSLLKVTLDCFSRHIQNNTVSILDTLSFPAASSLLINTSVCETCGSYYETMLSMYHGKLVRLNIQHGEFQVTEFQKYTNYRFAVCFDIQYAVNRTEWAWAQLMRCQNPQLDTIHIVLPVLVCSVFVILFHSLVYFVFRRPVQMLIYQPKRVEPVNRSGVSQFGPSPSVHGQLSHIASYGTMATTSLHRPLSQQQPSSSSRSLIHIDRDRLL